MSKSYVNMIEAIAKRDGVDVRKVLNAVDEAVDKQHKLRDDAISQIQKNTDEYVNAIFDDMTFNVKVGTYDF